MSVLSRLYVRTLIGLLLVGHVAAVHAFPGFTYHKITGSGSKGGGTSLVDVDGDGDLDLLFPHNGRGAYHCYEYKGPDNWTDHTIGSPTDTDVGGSAADIDGDGKIDAVTCKKWFRNKGNHSWEKHEYSGSGGNHDVVCGDINGDGKMDIVCQKGGSHLEWYKNPGNPTSNHSWSKTKIAGGIHGGTAPRGIGDLDGDGDNDVIRGDNWYENKDGKGTSWSSHNISHSIRESRFGGGLAVRTWICDINRDGKNDFVLSGCDIGNGPVYWYEGNGSGGFSRHTIAENLNNDFHSLGVADFDNDGDLDVTAGGAREGSVKKVYIWENTDGKGNFKQHEIAKVWQSHELSVGDVDGDGDIDICSKGWGGGEVYFLQNKSQGTPPPKDDTPPSRPSNLAANPVGQSQIDLSWNAASDDQSGVSSYTIYRDGSKVASSNNTSYSDKGLDGGKVYTYRVSAVNGDGLEGGRSDEASASTLGDENPPHLASVAAVSETSVTVVFDEPVANESAENVGNYSISDGIGVTGASLGDDLTTVTLTVSALREGKTYTLTVNNVTDRAPSPNTIADNSRGTFQLLPYVQGRVAYDYYTGSFSGLPDFSTLTPAATGTTTGFTIDVREQESDYALRFSGRIEITSAGEYSFYTESDDGSALYINGNKIVDNDGSHGMQEKEGTVSLDPGLHPITVVYYQAGGGQGLKVRWSGNETAKQEIPSERLHAPGSVTTLSRDRGGDAPLLSAARVNGSGIILTVSGLGGESGCEVYSLSGRLLHKKVFVGSPGELSYYVPLNEWATAMVIVRLRTGSVYKEFAAPLMP